MRQSTRFNHALWTVLLASATAAGGSIASAAQNSQGGAEKDSPSHMAQSTQQENIEFSDQKLEAFVEARESVVEISGEWEERINNAESQDELNSLRDAAQQEMVQAVQEEGLSVNEYNLIVDATQTNPDLRQRVNEMITQ